MNTPTAVISARSAAPRRSRKLTGGFSIRSRLRVARSLPRSVHAETAPFAGSRWRIANKPANSRRRRGTLRHERQGFDDVLVAAHAGQPVHRGGVVSLSAAASADPAGCRQEPDAEALDLRPRGRGLDRV